MIVFGIRLYDFFKDAKLIININNGELKILLNLQKLYFTIYEKQSILKRLTYCSCGVYRCLWDLLPFLAKKNYYVVDNPTPIRITLKSITVLKELFQRDSMCMWI
jgi:hypothetical protein